MKTLSLFIAFALAVSATARDVSLLRKENLAAWCIVPFDAKKRGPAERAEMLNRLGITKLAYDWRGEHIPTFDAEVEAMKSHGIEISAWWMSRGMDESNRKIFETIERHKIHPQLWVLIDEPKVDGQPAKVKAAADQIRPIAEEGKRLGCKVALYNHGGWFGEPENQLAILDELKADNVGIVYNFHHAHQHIDRFPEWFAKMKPHLLALNLNGMIKDGDKQGKKILPIGSGDQEQKMIETVLDSGWTGTIGILNHLPDQDAEVILERNLKGLEVLSGKINTADYWKAEDPAERAKLPEFKTIPAGSLDKMTTVSASEKLGSSKDWTRSHGDQAGTRFSHLKQIDTTNVSKLKQAWVYHSKDGTGNIQCNPVIVN
ncbi:MAG TPA: TIM barrel protein, partial [Luteolibacter sp.]|nr:TIM barrel protein [Luteolibacter sp.]